MYTNQILCQAACKSLEIICVMILNQLQPTFAAKTVTNEKMIFESHAETCLDWMGFIFNPKNFEQSATQNFSPLCYWSTIDNSFLNICPKFQVASFNSEVDFF